MVFWMGSNLLLLKNGRIHVVVTKIVASSLYRVRDGKNVGGTIGEDIAHVKLNYCEATGPKTVSRLWSLFTCRQRFTEMDIPGGMVYTTMGRVPWK